MGYNFRVGYSEGFNQALTGKTNEYESPEAVWHSEESLSLKIKGDPDEPEDEVWCHKGGEEPEHYKTGYNWGYMHGHAEREKSRPSVPEEDFEEYMEAFAGSIRILYMQINKERYLVGVFETDPEEEKSSREKFISEFINSSKVNPDKNILQQIKTLLATNNSQRAIDLSLTCFRDNKTIIDYYFSLSIRSKLMYLHEDSKKERIDKADYLREKTALENKLLKFVEEKIEH